MIIVVEVSIIAILCDYAMLMIMLVIFKLFNEQVDGLWRILFFEKNSHFALDFRTKP